MRLEKKYDQREEPFCVLPAFLPCLMLLLLLFLVGEVDTRRNKKRQPARLLCWSTKKRKLCDFSFSCRLVVVVGGGAAV